MSTDLEVSGPQAGELVFPDGNELISRGVKGSTEIVKGNPVTFDTNGYMTNATTTSTIADGLGVALQDADNNPGSDGDVKCQAAMGNTYVYAKLGASPIKPFSLLKVGASNKLIAHTKPSDASATPTSAQVNAARDYFGLTFGRYWGHQKEEDNPTTGVTNEVVAVRLGV
jgi:hypothetical protein